MYLSRDEVFGIEVRNWRTLVFKSELVRLFAGLLTNLNARVQLACLKFYHAVSFECIDAARAIMTATYYDCALLDLIAAYLSRENRYHRLLLFSYSFIITDFISISLNFHRFN